MISDRIDAFLADKGYDADAIREEISSANIEAVIPTKSNRRQLRCTPNLDHGELEFSGFMAQSGGDAAEPFISEIGTLLPMALCGRNSL